MNRRRDGLPSFVDEDSFLECGCCFDMTHSAGRKQAVRQIEARATHRERERVATLVENRLLELVPLFNGGPAEKIAERCTDLLLEILDRAPTKKTPAPRG